MPNLTVRYANDSLIEVGVDEAGRGCLWGPLYAAAVIWPPEEEWLDDHKEIAPQIRDSKKLSAKKRQTLSQAIQALAIDVGIGIVTPQEIDSFGMTFANKLAFCRAIDQLQVPPDRVLLDGILSLDVSDVQSRKIQEQQTIVAKQARDEYVEACIETSPDLETKYNLGSCKGYGTEKHRKGIVTYGKHPGHRDLFLRKLLGNKSDCLISDS